MTNVIAYNSVTIFQKGINMSGYDNEIKIIGGVYKGKIIPINNAEGLRPTPARVRETIFSWINSNISNAKVLDLFAGSGALGFEALSRGATKVVLVEKNPNSASMLKNVANTLSSEQIDVVCSDAINYLENCRENFDIIFIDPPYKLDIYEQTLNLILKKNLIDDNSIIYVEMRNGSNQIVPGLECIREQTAGQAKYTLMKKSSLLF